jgi:putative copper export protein
VAAFSRIFLIMIWIARPVYFNAAFSTIIIPCLGFLFLPFTTLMYLFLIQGAGGIQGLDWLWLLLAVVLDVASIGAAGAANRDRLPASVPGSTAGQQPPPPPQPPTQNPPAPPQAPSGTE